ncbi:MAG: DUF4173 domain-containing protein [Saprospiraceae bacterium]|nr:DUF4173 domain-containing protein [Saprospiraceae bacterium]
MKRKSQLVLIAIGATLFTLVFYKQGLGLNLLIFEAVALVYLISKRQLLSHTMLGLSLIGVLATLLNTILTHSVFSYVVHLLAFLLFIGSLNYPQAKSLITSGVQAIISLFDAQWRSLKGVSDLVFKEENPIRIIWRLRMFFVPVIILILFVAIYRASNPVFDGMVNDILIFLETRFAMIFNRLDLPLLFTFLLGVIVCNFIIIRSGSEKINKKDFMATDDLKRRRKKHRIRFGTLALKREYQAGLFLLIALNILILVLNAIDVYWVWFNFEWEGQYLKQFVHEGTYLLILSILISIALVLYFFRGNINFLNNNSALRNLSYLWLAQNAVLTLSVAIRNFWYIHHFSLAYKRIGVIIFLLLTLYGLYTVMIKVRDVKTSYYLFRSNAFAIYMVLILSSLLNWDNVIARYNFSHADRSFLHLDYLSTLSDKTLPYLDHSLQELMALDEIQKEKFPFEDKFMTVQEYHDIINKRKEHFLTTWEKESVLSWNIPEYLAYRRLIE